VNLDRPTLITPAGLTPAGLTPADRVTLSRAGLLVLVAVLVLLRPLVDPGQWGWAVLGVSVPMLLLDAVDGAVARRTVVTDRGARWDMETDAATVLVLSFAAAPAVGVWVIAAGLMRYAFVLAGAVLPALRGPLPPSQTRRVVAAVQGPALLLAVAPGLPVAVAVVGCALALGALTFSFGRDALALARGGAHPPKG